MYSSSKTSGVWILEAVIKSKFVEFLAVVRVVYENILFSVLLILHLFIPSRN